MVCSSKSNKNLAGGMGPNALVSKPSQKTIGFNWHQSSLGMIASLADQIWKEYVALCPYGPHKCIWNSTACVHSVCVHVSIHMFDVSFWENSGIHWDVLLKQPLILKAIWVKICVLFRAASLWSRCWKFQGLGALGGWKGVGWKDWSRGNSFC